MQGRGVRTFPDGSRYEGEHDEGERTGRGTFTAANGDVYEGSWAANTREGADAQCARADAPPSCGASALLWKVLQCQQGCVWAC